MIETGKKFEISKGGGAPNLYPSKLLTESNEFEPRL